jgi:hypothetical protein
MSQNVAAAEAAVATTKANLGVASRVAKYAAPENRANAAAALRLAKQKHAEALMALRVQQIAAAAPPLSSDQRSRLGALIASVGGAAAPNEPLEAPALRGEGTHR